MAFNRRFSKASSREKNITCSCGNNAKLSSCKNYPFGKKSSSVVSWFYKCKTCNKRIFINDSKGGKK